MLTTAPTIAPSRRRHEGLLQIGVMLLAVGVYELARLLMTPNRSLAIANARRIVELDSP